MTKTVCDNFVFDAKEDTEAFLALAKIADSIVFRRWVVIITRTRWDSGASSSLGLDGIVGRFMPSVLCADWISLLKHNVLPTYLDHTENPFHCISGLLVSVLGEVPI